MLVMGMTQGDSEDRILDGSPDDRRRLKPCNPELKVRAGKAKGGDIFSGGDVRSIAANC
jgi:hypothetical protein